MTDGVTIHVGDVRDVLAGLPDGSVDCCVTSPPYWALRDYGVDGQLGLEPTPDEYVANMVAVFREVRRVLADHGTCWVNLGDSYANTTSGGGSVFDNGRTDGRRSYDTDAVRGRGQFRTLAPGLKPKDLVGIPWRVAFALQQPYYAGRIKDERDRIWLAAMVEAEGCMFIHRRKAGQSNGQGYERKNDTYGAGLEVSSTDRVIVERCMEIAGAGSVCEQAPSQNHRRKQTLYRWNMRTNECRDIIRELYPHFLAKKHEARLLLGCPSSGDDARKAHESLKAIHQGHKPCIDFGEPEGMWERGWFLRSEIIWSKKPNPMPESVTDRPTKAHEQIFLLSKQPRYFFDAEAVREPHKHDGRAVTTVVGGNGSIQHRDGERWPNGGRNVRSVWTIATQPYPEAHFATFPEELPRRCILAGCPEWVCATCGKPRERMIEFLEESTYMKLKRQHGHEWTDMNAARNARGVTRQSDKMGGNTATPSGTVPSLKGKDRRTTGWSDCGHGNYRPGVVLDPFGGSGTVAVVARRERREAILVELNPEYAELARRRVARWHLPPAQPVAVPEGQPSLFDVLD